VHKGEPYETLQQQLSSIEHIEVWRKNLGY